MTVLYLYWIFDVICQSSGSPDRIRKREETIWLVSFYFIPFWFHKGTYHNSHITYHDNWGHAWPVKCLVHLFCCWRLTDVEGLMAWQNMICNCVFVYLCIWMYSVRCTCSWRLTDGISDGERLMSEPRPERGASGEALAHLTILPPNFTFPFPTFYKAWKVGFGCSNLWDQDMLGSLVRFHGLYHDLYLVYC